MEPRRSVLGLVFLTVFLDIVGFSVIFPLFPDLLDHYLALEGADSFLGELITRLEKFAGGDSNAVATLFGGLLGSIYGLLPAAVRLLHGLGRAVRPDRQAPGAAGDADGHGPQLLAVGLRG